MSDVINVAVRYVITDLDPIMQPDPIGAWVHMEDYHAQTARIEELEEELEKAVQFTEGVIRYAGNSGDDYLAEQARTTLAAVSETHKLTGETG